MTMAYFNKRQTCCAPPLNARLVNDSHQARQGRPSALPLVCSPCCCALPHNILPYTWLRSTSVP